MKEECSKRKNIGKTYFLPLKFLKLSLMIEAKL